MNGIVFFDDRGGQLDVLTDLRASFCVRTGALTTWERWAGVLGVEVVGAVVPGELAELVREDVGFGVNDGVKVEGAVLGVNGRCVLVPEEARGLGAGRMLIEKESGEVVACCGDVGLVRRVVGGDVSGCEIVELEGQWLMARPWHIRASRDAAIRVDLELLRTRVDAEGAGRGEDGGHGRDARATRFGGMIHFGEHALTVHPEARVCPGAVIDTEGGAVVIDEGAEVRPGAKIVGPVYVGKNSFVAEHALLKANTAIGPWCKVGGEVGGTIFQGYANKVHDGHLGDSWVGAWANLGAGTTNSNLLNTYGEVVSRARPGGNQECTGEVFVGATIGDHVKSAICTRIMTGAVLHTGVMYAASEAASGCLGRFGWHTDKGVSVFRAEKFVEIARAVMGRRKVEMSRAYEERVCELYAETESA